MKLHRVIAAAFAVASISFIAPIAEAKGPVVAKLRTSVAARTKVVAGGAVFQCVGGACVSAAPNDRTVAVGACKELVKAVGPVDSYGDDLKQLEADKLAACNG
ncbi:CC_3452 family protein [Phenylobacterium sp.]|uniref:CC_3452 family protein n=1 Tax=Phenylobacterium sp. TaxID=1871053 RepID=UPI002E31202C|nr:hypothetical protein [Phenylobacterium sp.]HEX2561122.1 hypothetical protein [Phenylobacterium sp.]